MPRGQPKGQNLSYRELFDAKWIPEPNTGCWLWTAYVGRDGYGKGGYKGIPGEEKAHRIAWILYRGPIPKGMWIDHVCRVRSCVNPDHIRLVTPRLNAIENSVSGTAANAAKQCCPKCGGGYSRKRYRIHGKTKDCRICRPCVNRQQRAGTLRRALANKGRFRDPKTRKYVYATSTINLDSHDR